MGDFIYWGSQVQKRVTFGHARQRFLDALVHHDGLIYKVYNEENTQGGLEFTYLTLYLLLPSGTQTERHCQASSGSPEMAIVANG